MTDRLDENARGVASRLLAREQVDHTLQPTALVHEVFLRFQRDRRFADAERGAILAHGARAIERTCAGDFPPPGARRPGLHAELDSIVTMALAEEAARRSPAVEGSGGGPQLASIDARIALGICAMRAGDTEEALARFGDAVALAERALPDWHAKAAFARGRLGDLLAQLGRYDEAVPLLVASWRAQNRLAGAGNAISVQLRERIASAYEAWGRPAEAARWRTTGPREE